MNLIPNHVIDYGQYDKHGPCPHCGRCRDCGQPSLAPVVGVGTWPYRPMPIAPSAAPIGQPSTTAPLVNTNPCL